jgi:hypothetical protein
MSENIAQTRTSRSGFGCTLRLKPPPATEPTSAPPPSPTTASPPAPARAPSSALPPAEAARIAQRVADLALCRERFPAVFDLARPVPLAIGVHKTLAAILSHVRAKYLVIWWTRHPAYVAAVAAGGSRYNLDGTEAGEISEEHRAVARLGRAGRAKPGLGGSPGVDVCPADRTAPLAPPSTPETGQVS